ncbi:MAG: peptidoglycan DD-metalloendopeptidase family protein [bacterium]|nr:peptidoglycan DD-metalloendopeptidase family protein [bacterium]
MFKRIRKTLAPLTRDIKEFGRLWYWYLYRRGYKLFMQFEKIKGFIAKSLYRQRGRFSRPFIHVSMGGLIALGVTLAPVLAESFPGIGDDPWTDVPPSSIVREVTDDGTSTVVSDKVRDKVVEYEVQPGDTVSVIAEKFGVDSDTIRWENNLASVNDIRPRQTLRILPVSGINHKVARGETIYSIAKKYNANPQAMVDFPFNNFADNETFALAVGQTIIVPDGVKPNQIPWSPSLAVSRRTPDAGAVSATGQFVWPAGGLITQRYVWYHKGVDIANPSLPSVLAADAGRVVVAGWVDNSGYGNRIIIDHNNGYQTLYAHLSRIYVTVGQTVKRGDAIGQEGSTGRSTGPHLHFEIRRGGVAVNPLEYLR